MRTEKKEKMRRKILEVAGQLFKDKGFAATSMREIADECQIAVGTLYNYFKSKGEMFIEIAGSQQLTLATNFNEGAESWEAVKRSIRKQILSDIGTITEVEKIVWREIFQAITSQGETSQFFRSLTNLDKEYLTAVRNYLARKSVLLPEAYPIDLTLEVLYHSLGGLVLHYLYSEMSDQVLEEKASCHIDYILGK